MGRLRSTGGFWLLLGALLLAAPLSLVGWTILACAVHEVGHLLAIRALGGRVEALRLTGLGAVMIPRGVFSYRDDGLAALAGPAASVLLALLAAPVQETLAGVSLVLGLFNLLPIVPLDGGRILTALLSRKFGPDRGEKVGFLVGQILSFLLMGMGLWVVLRGGSFTLLLFGTSFFVSGDRTGSL